MHIIKVCTCLVFVLAVFLSGCMGVDEEIQSSAQPIPQISLPKHGASDTDASDSLVMGRYVIGGIEHIAPVYSDLHNDFITRNYESMAQHAQQLLRVVENELAGIGYDDRSANTFATKLSRKDSLLHSKYEGYLKRLRSMAISAQVPASWIRNDPSKLSQNELVNEFKDTFSLSKEAKFQLESLLNSCTEYKTDCGQKLSTAKDLSREITFL